MYVDSNTPNFILAQTRGLTFLGVESRKMEPLSDTHLEDEPIKQCITVLKKLEFLSIELNRNKSIL